MTRVNSFAPNDRTARLKSFLFPLLALLLSLAMIGAGYWFTNQYQQQAQVREGQRFNQQANVIVEQQINHWRDELRAASQIGGPLPLRALTRSGVILPDGTSTTLQLTAADLDLFNRIRSNAPNQQTLAQQGFEIRGEGAQAQVVGMIAAPATGNYILMQWPITPLQQALEKASPAGQSVWLAQNIAGQQQTPLQIRATGPMPAGSTLSVAQWTLATAPGPIDGKLPLWVTLFCALSGLLPLALSLLGRRQRQVDSSEALSHPEPVKSEPMVAAVEPPSSRSIAAEVAPLGRPIELAAPVDDPSITAQLSHLPLEPVDADGPNLQKEPASKQPDPLEALIAQPYEPETDRETSAPELPEDSTLKLAPHDAVLTDQVLVPDRELVIPTLIDPATQAIAHLFQDNEIKGNLAEFTSEFVQQLGAVLGQHFRNEGQRQVVTGRDHRQGNEILQQHLNQGLLQAGIQVVDAGCAPIPVIRLGSQQYQGNTIILSGGNGSADVGTIQWTLAGRQPNAAEVQHLLQQMQKTVPPAGLPGKLRKQDFQDSYLEAVLADIVLLDEGKISLDGLHGTMGSLAAEALRRLGWQVDALHIELDAELHEGVPDSTRADRLQDLMHDVVINQSDFGVAFDGHGERLALVDAQGQLVSQDQIMLLLTAMTLQTRPGSDIAYDVRYSRTIPQTVTAQGGRPVVIAANVAALLGQVQTNAELALGGEFSGCYVLQDERGHQLPDPFYALLRLLEWLGQSGQTLATALADLPSRVGTPEVQLTLLDGQQAADVITYVADQAALMPDASVSRLDGVRVDFAAGFGLLRQVTPQQLGLRLEAADEIQLQQIRTQFTQWLEATLAHPVQLSDSEPGLLH